MSNSCQECGKILTEKEMRNHPFVYCEMAKAFPTKWREYIKQIQDFAFESNKEEVKEE